MGIGLRKAVRCQCLPWTRSHQLVTTVVCLETRSIIYTQECQDPSFPLNLPKTMNTNNSVKLTVLHSLLCQTHLHCQYGTCNCIITVGCVIRTLCLSVSVCGSLCHGIKYHLFNSRHTWCVDMITILYMRVCMQILSWVWIEMTTQQQWYVSCAEWMRGLYNCCYECDACRFITVIEGFFYKFNNFHNVSSSVSYM